MKVIKETLSACPKCKKIIPARIIEQNNELIMRKKCVKHGVYEDKYWSAKTYFKFMKYPSMNAGVSNPQTKYSSCPASCGLCSAHKSNTILGIIDITNKCDLKCPVCFANAGAPRKEPSLEDLSKIMDAFRQEKPYKAVSLGLTGGEPTIRNDLPEIIALAKKKGFPHVQVASNGLRLAQDPEFFKSLQAAGLNTLYLQFDGVTNKTYIKIRGRKLLDIKKKVISNARSIGFKSIVLVMTVVKGVNDHEIGELINFAIKNSDVVRAVNFQPVAFTGRINKNQRKQQRITTPEVIKRISEQTNNKIKESDFFPGTYVEPLCVLHEELVKKSGVRFSFHPLCGACTYLYLKKENDYGVITELINAKKIYESLNKCLRLVRKNWLMKQFTKLYLVYNALRYTGGVFRRVLLNALFKNDYNALREFSNNTIFIGIMHFMDLYNLDLERLQRCVVHYGVIKNGRVRIIPFCAYNNFYRE